jgi:hypothetical protein
MPNGIRSEDLSLKIESLLREDIMV